MDVNKGWNNFEIIFYLTCNHGVKYFCVSHCASFRASAFHRVFS